MTLTVALLYIICRSVCWLVDMEEFLDQVGSRLPTLRGIKFTSPDLHQLGRCVVHSNGKYSILYGCDQVCVCVPWSRLGALTCSHYLSVVATTWCSCVGMYICCWQVQVYLWNVDDWIMLLTLSYAQYLQLHGKTQQSSPGSCSTQWHGDSSSGAEAVTSTHQITGEIWSTLLCTYTIIENSTQVQTVNQYLWSVPDALQDCCLYSQMQSPL